MGSLSITPETFSMVLFDAAEIRSVAEQLLERIGFPSDADVVIEVDETIPLGRTTMTVDGRTVTLHIEGGAFEDPKRPRKLSPGNAKSVLGRLFLRARDRLDPSFGDAPGDDELVLAQRAAWDTYSEGRLERLGYPQRDQRRRYHFRMRHGFTDVADRVFDRLWSSDGLRWADLQAACAETGAVPAARA